MNILRFLIPKSSVEYIYDTSTVRQALEKMKYHKYMAIPVIDSGGRYVATLRNSDIFRYYYDRGAFNTQEAEHDRIAEIYDRDYCRPLRHDAGMNEIFDMVKEHNFVPVIDDRDCFIGIILRRDVLEFLKKFYNSSLGEEK